MSDQHRNALPAGYRLENFRFESVLGHGGFGITYRAEDEDFQQAVAIKEYLPREVALRDHDSAVVPVSELDRDTFEWGLERFLDEARTLARFRHANIVGVRRFIRANGTAYLVMDYCDGESLETLLEREGTLNEDQLETLLVPLFAALETLHDAGVTHRDIKPGNIYLREDGSPVLLDFGAARQALAQHSRSVTAMATPGYAAFEQYSTKGKQGPWTDIYGLGATLYRCVTGRRLPDASDRMLEDELVPAVEAASGRYPRPLLGQIDAALRLRPEDRPQSIGEWGNFWRGSAVAQPGGVVVDTTPVQALRLPKLSAASGRVAGAGRILGWLGWLFIVGAVLAFFIWGGNEQADHQSSATATRDSPSPRTAPSQSPATGSSAPDGLIEGRYQVIGAHGEIVRDTVTGLDWQRCSVGQTWDGSTCAGQAGRYNWQRARALADELLGWRLPANEELRTLVFCSSGQPARFKNSSSSCSGEFRRPTIVAEVFPNTPSSFFWSASPYAGRSDYAWSVNFGYGNDYWSNLSYSFRIRLVRGGQ